MIINKCYEFVSIINIFDTCDHVNKNVLRIERKNNKINFATRTFYYSFFKAIKTRKIIKKRIYQEIEKV